MPVVAADRTVVIATQHTQFCRSSAVRKKESIRAATERFDTKKKKKPKDCDENYNCLTYSF